MTREEELREIFAEAKERFRPGRIERSLCFYFTFGDGPGEKWTAWISKDACEVREGKHAERADCVIKTSASFFLQMVRDGYVPGAMDFLRGKIKSNEPLLLRELQRALGL